MRWPSSPLHGDHPPCGSTGAAGGPARRVAPVGARAPDGSGEAGDAQGMSARPALVALAVVVLVARSVPGVVALRALRDEHGRGRGGRAPDAGCRRRVLLPRRGGRTASDWPTSSTRRTGAGSSSSTDGAWITTRVGATDPSTFSAWPPRRASTRHRRPSTRASDEVLGPGQRGSHRRVPGRDRLLARGVVRVRHRLPTVPRAGSAVAGGGAAGSVGRAASRRPEPARAVSRRRTPPRRSSPGSAGEARRPPSAAR